MKKDTAHSVKGAIAIGAVVLAVLIIPVVSGLVILTLLAAATLFLFKESLNRKTLA